MSSPAAGENRRLEFWYRYSTGIPYDFELILILILMQGRSFERLLEFSVMRFLGPKQESIDGYRNSRIPDPAMKLVGIPGVSRTCTTHRPCANWKLLRFKGSENTSECDTMCPRYRRYCTPISIFGAVIDNRSLLPNCVGCLSAPVGVRPSHRHSGTPSRPLGLQTPSECQLAFGKLA